MSGRARGFTLPEVLISSMLLAGILLGGLLASRSSLVSTTESVVESETFARAGRVVGTIAGTLMAASRSTLQAAPAGGPVGPMQDGVQYDNVTFRRALRFSNAATVFDPPMGEAPLGFRLEADPSSPGRSMLMFDGANVPRVLARNVTQLEFSKNGNQLMVTVALDVRDGGQWKSSTVRRPLVLRSP